MGDIAAKEWRRLVEIFGRRGLLDDLKVAAISAYCVAFGRWVEAEQFIRDKGMWVKDQGGNLRRNPMLDIARESSRDMRAYMKELNLVRLGDLTTEDGRPVTVPAETRDMRDFFPGVKH